MKSLSGQFYRVIFARDLPNVLQGIRHPEGRFHHDGQPAIYMSPSPETAAIAVATYIRPGDPARITVPLGLDGANMLDFRRPDVEKSLGLTGGETSVTWQDQRAVGLPATSWLASDAARDAGADGMIYPSRKEPSRWHIVLFRWNRKNAPELSQSALPLVFDHVQ